MEEPGASAGEVGGFNKEIQFVSKAEPEKNNPKPNRIKKWSSMFAEID